MLDQLGRGDARAVAVGALAFLLLGVGIEGLSGVSNWTTGTRGALTDLAFDVFLRPRTSPPRSW